LLRILTFRGLNNKCASNSRLYNISELSDKLSNYNQQLNSTLVDPNNIPNLLNSTSSGMLQDSNPQSTMSGDNINLNPNNLNGGGMDKIF
jgi:hypothetical protein